MNKDLYTIPYLSLVEAAGTPHILKLVEAFLREVAEWCEREGWPPLNALAVNGETRVPGEGYDSAGGFQIVEWPKDVERCIRFKGYPPAVP